MTVFGVQYYNFSGIALSFSYKIGIWTWFNLSAAIQISIVNLLSSPPSDQYHLPLLENKINNNTLVNRDVFFLQFLQTHCIEYMYSCIRLAVSSRQCTPLCHRLGGAWLFTRLLTKTLPGQTKIHQVHPEFFTREANDFLKPNHSCIYIQNCVNQYLRTFAPIATAHL